MTAKDILNINGNFKESPIISTVQKLHHLLDTHKIPYAIIGGLAVIRNGGYRTTHDIDILTIREKWESLRKKDVKEFSIGLDYAEDLENHIPIDVLFKGDNWEMVFTLPDPTETAEYDTDLKANFFNLFHIIQLKMAVYLHKKKEDGIELAAKDLADVVLLIQNNRDKIEDEFINSIHPGVRSEFKKIVKKTKKSWDLR